MAWCSYSWGKALHTHSIAKHSSTAHQQPLTAGLAA
jgi:hypothetical protein